VRGTLANGGEVRRVDTPQLGDADGVAAILRYAIAS
jgi:hypothetical protein